MITGVQNTIYYIIEYDVPTILNFVYIERLNIVDALTIQVFEVVNPASHVQIASASQVDDFLYVDVSVEAKSSYAIQINTDNSPPANLTMTAPFLGGTDLAGLADYKYINGRSYKYAPTVTFQRTKTASYAESSNEVSKPFAIPNVKSEHVDYYYEFMIRNAGKLVLFREHEGGSRHNFSLGYLVPGDGVRPIEDHDFAFSIEYKNIGAQRYDSLSTYSAPFVPPSTTLPSFTRYIDTNGSHPTYGLLVGAVDGVETEYTVSLGSYDAGSVEVIYRGMQQTDFTETSPSTGLVTIGFAPKDSSQDNELLIKYEITT